MPCAISRGSQTLAWRFGIVANSYRAALIAVLSRHSSSTLLELIVHLGYRGLQDKNAEPSPDGNTLPVSIQEYLAET